MENKIPEEIIKNHNLKEYRSNGWWKGAIELPFGTFFHFFKYIDSKDIVIRMSVKNLDDEDLFATILSQIDTSLEEIKTNALTKIGLANANLFDSLIFAPFEFTIIPPSGFSDFDKKQIQVIPIRCYEASGNESVKEFNTMLSTTLVPPDWNREPIPKIRYKFSNPRHKYGTVGKSFVIDIETNVYAALGKFDSNDCFMEVINNLDESLLIQYNNENQVFTLDNNKTYKYDDLLTFLKTFFRKCD